MSKEAKALRAKNVDELHDRMVQQRLELLREPSWEGRAEDEPQLWNTINHFLRKDTRAGNNGSPISLFFAHANGFPKEMWETIIARLIQLYHTIDEIFVFEAANHGDSALINADNLGDTFDWTDSARDVLQFLIYHRPLQSSPSLSTHLPPHAPEATPRKVIGIGHSLGGGTLARAAIYNPSLFSALILVDPVIKPDHGSVYTKNEIKRYQLLHKGALSRRSVWSSLYEARTSFLRSPFFQAWEPLVLDLYVNHGIAPINRTNPEGPVMLKQSPYDEAATFVDMLSATEVYYLLHTLPAEVELRWIMNGKGAEATGGEEYTAHTVWRRPANSSNVRILESGHLIAQEAPFRLAGEIAIVLERRFGPSGSRADPGSQSIKARI